MEPILQSDEDFKKDQIKELEKQKKKMVKKEKVDANFESVTVNKELVLKMLNRLDELETEKEKEKERKIKEIEKEKERKIKEEERYKQDNLNMLESITKEASTNYISFVQLLQDNEEEQLTYMVENMPEFYNNFLLVKSKIEKIVSKD
jgi:phage-related minor tail protein